MTPTGSVVSVHVNSPVCGSSAHVSTVTVDGSESSESDSATGVDTAGGVDVDAPPSCATTGSTAPVAKRATMAATVDASSPSRIAVVTSDILLASKGHFLPRNLQPTDPPGPRTPDFAHRSIRSTGSLPPQLDAWWPRRWLPYQGPHPSNSCQGILGRAPEHSGSGDRREVLLSQSRP